MWKTIVLMAVAAIMGTGCSVTPLLNPPVDDKQLDVAANKALIGKWKANLDETVYELDITWHLDEKDKTDDLLQIAVNSIRDAKIKPFPPMIAGVFKIDNELYITFCTDLEKLFENKYAEESIGMVRPNFFIAKLTPDNANFKLEWINFFNQTQNIVGKNTEVPIDPLARKENGLVMNSTKELQKLLKEKKYKLQAPIILQRISK